MKSLREILDAQTSDEVVLARDFEGVVDGLPVVVQVALENTAVVYEHGHVDDKRVVNLKRVFVADRNVRWLPRNPTELRIMRSRQTGLRLGAGARPKG